MFHYIPEIIRLKMIRLNDNKSKGRLLTYGNIFEKNHPILFIAQTFNIDRDY